MVAVLPRQSMTDQVYIAVPRKTGKAALTAIRRNKMLCRRLGIGLITVRLSDGAVVVHCEPAPFTPRKIKARKTACKASYVAKMAGFEKARNCMAANHYGWFEKVDRGVYGLTPKGAKALESHADVIP